MIQILDLRVGVSGEWGRSMLDHLDATFASWQSGKGWQNELVFNEVYLKLRRALIYGILS